MLKFSIPCVLSLLVSALYNIVDQIFIGNSELSALGNAATGIVVTLSASVILTAIFFLLKTQLLTLFGASENSIEMAIEYFNIILAFFPVYMLSNMMNAVIRADGSPSWSMASMLIGAIINIILDPIFIFGLHWGMKGAVLATVIGQFVSLVISFLYFFRTKTFKLTKKSFIPDLKAFAGALKLGTSSFITQMTIVIISLVCNIMLAKYGADIPIAIISIESKVFTVVINLVVGIVLGCQPIIGYNMGAKNYDRVKKLYKSILLCTVVIGIVSTLLFELAPQTVVGVFGTPTNIPNPEDYWVFAEKTFRIFLALVTFTCIIKMTSIFFQAVGKPAQAVISSMIRDIVCFIPLILILPNFFGIEGIQGVIITIGREHGSSGKQIGKLVAEKLGIPFYYKEMTALAAQDKVIRKIAEQGSCVIVGRAANYVLRSYKMS